MKRAFIFSLALCTLLRYSTLAQPGAGSANFVLLVVPESDTTVTESAVYRLSASTKPGSSVMLNDRKMKVYPSGAFAGLLPLNIGENLFTITATDDSGKTAFKTFLVVRSKPLETTRTDTLAIEDAMMEPAADMWLNDGDILELQIKGTPHCKATFMNGIPMQEIPVGANGLGGIYRGRYKVTSSDTLTARPIEFSLTDSAGHVVKRQSKALVSFMGQQFPLIGIVRGERPYLNFGLGEDRLGGARLSYINPGVRLTITGKIGDQYRVALTKNLQAWIPEYLVNLQPAGTRLPYSLTSNWLVYGDEKYDYVSVGMTDMLPYASFLEFAPTRIILDLFGAVSNTNWIIQQLTAKEITNVYYTMVGEDQFRITIELRHKQAWGYAVSYVGSNLVIKIRRQPERLKLKALTIALDAGHGGDNNGARGSTGALEKDVNLATVMHLKNILEDRGAKVILTRTADTNVTMNDRVRTVLASGADILISVHSNSIGVTSNPEDTKGVSTYYKYVCYRPLSLCILQEVLKMGLAPFGNVGSFNFSLNSPTELPNALVEMAFISNPEDEIKLLDDDFRKDIAKKIVNGIDDFLDSCNE